MEKLEHRKFDTETDECSDVGYYSIVNVKSVNVKNVNYIYVKLNLSDAIERQNK